jgi:hypothetical protein
VLRQAVGLGCFVVFAGAGAASPVARDPPRIVPWHEIGNIGFGMTHARVEAAYGAPINGNPPHDTIVWAYRGRGVIRVIFGETGYVEDVSTTSSAYATRSGIRVGMRIPRASKRWRGFIRHGGEWDRSATYGPGPVRAYVQLTLGRGGAVEEISLGRYLHCPWGDAAVATCKLPPPPPEPPPPAGTRYCTHPGGPGNFLAASPDVQCATARHVEAKVFSSACGNDNRCVAHGFTCLAFWDGRYDRPFSYTHHAICRNGAQRIEIDEG